MDKKKYLLDRSEAVEYFNDFEIGEDGIYFYKNNAFFISETVTAMAEVKGPRLRDVLVFEYLGDVRWSPEDTDRIATLEQKFFKQYDTFLYFPKQILCDTLGEHKIKAKRKGIVEFLCSGDFLTITVNIEGKETRYSVSLKQYSMHIDASYSDFSFRINALLLDKIICRGLTDCEKVGIKFSAGSDVIFFNRNRNYFYRYWAISPTILEINRSV